MTGRRAILAALGAIFLACLIRVAWISDDTFIIFRTIDNFSNGFGLRWNVAERVQVFTNPLWTLLLLVANALTGELFFTTVAISLGLTALTWWILVSRFARSTSAAAGVTALLLYSGAFMDFSTSGLENPLTHLLLVTFVAVYLSPRPAPWPAAHTALLVLCAALGMCNRLDTLLLFLPALGHHLWHSWRASGGPATSIDPDRPGRGDEAFALARLARRMEGALKGRIPLAILVGLTPLVIWEAFSLLYYGFLFPNTAYAKLGHGIGRSQMIEQGLHYLRDAWDHDRATLLTIGLGIGVALRRPWTRPAMIALGAALYVVYVIWVGGGFMSGRFFAAPFVAALPLLLQLDWRPRPTVLALGALGLAHPLPDCLDPDPIEFGLRHDHGIVDERSFYFRYYGLLPVLREPQMLEKHSNALHARKLLDELKEIDDRPHVLPWNRVGQFGYLVGPDVHIIDSYALADPLLARMPALRNHNWRIGHFRRFLPPGYQESIESGEQRFEDEKLGQYFETLRLVTSGDLFGWNRIKEIVRFHLGKYDDLIDQNRYRMADLLRVDLGEIDEPVPQGTRRSDDRCRALSPRGIQIQLGSVVHNPRIEASLDHNDDYLIQFFREGRLEGEVVAESHRIPSKGVWVHTLDVPNHVASRGYDSIRVLPERGDRNSCIGHLRLL